MNREFIDSKYVMINGQQSTFGVWDVITELIKFIISKMDTESDNSWGLNSSFNITSLDPIM